MGFAVFHIEKVTTGAGSLGAHIDRSSGQEYTYKNADPNRLQENIHYDCGNSTKMKLNEAIDLRIKSAYTGKKALRKDAVKGLSMVFTGSHEEMKKIFSDENFKNTWLNANLDFVKNEFGVENIVRFSLHMDEKTPHIHAVVVPLTKDGRLSAKEVMGDRTAMSERQTRYADQMQPFGLERGIVGSKAIHNSERWYLGLQNKEQKAILSSVPEFSLLDRVNPSKFLETVSNRLIMASNLHVQADLEAKRRKAQLVTQEANLKRTSDALVKSQDDLQRTRTELKIVALRGTGILKPEFEQKAQDITQTILTATTQAREKERQAKIENQNPEKKNSKGMRR
ncbi:hypothetical protein GJU39_23140 [Pedobacter petrophilus]|uniref:Plasmid recombination enzyme n=1 Tax=Pedobacter petrophilus TaxID=1908241 RepID=A0A7K0G5P6_9SPHI|nr:MobV family relaxase [Pedobacter petrophilus]MRX78962.1 hypothetical protein [Pedobacter petrophilus]